MHVIPRFFVVDGQEQVSDPIGMFGQRLDIETHVVTGALTAIQNLSKCIEEAGVPSRADGTGTVGGCRLGVGR